MEKPMNGESAVDEKKEQAGKRPVPPQFLKNAKKGEGEGEEGAEHEGAETKDEEEQEEEAEEKSCGKKSVDLTGDDLSKSLGKLEALVQASDITSRKDALLQKAQKGEDLIKSERDELFQLLGGAEAQKSSEDLTKGLKENETLQKALDVSDFLNEQHTELCKSLGALGETVQKSDSRQHEFNLVLAKAVADVGNLVKAVAMNVGAIAAAPARAPKSAGVQGSTALQKGFAGGEAEADQLSKNDILNSLESMMEKSMERGEHGLSKGGEDLALAIAKFEQMNRMSPGLLEEVKAFRAVTH